MTDQKIEKHAIRKDWSRKRCWSMLGQFQCQLAARHQGCHKWWNLDADYPITWPRQRNRKESIKAD
jgi:hypothetical protein